MWSKTLPALSRRCFAGLGWVAFLVVGLLDLTQLISGVLRRTFIPKLRIVIRLFTAHPAGAMQLAFCKTARRPMRPCVDEFLTADSTEKFFLPMDGALALLTIITAAAVQLYSLLDSSGHLQESSRNHALLQETYLPREGTYIFHVISAFPFCVS